MNAFSKHRWLLVSIVHYLALFLIGQANYYLANFGISLFALGAIVSFSAMELNFKQGMLSLIPVALHLDSRSPLPFGFSLFALLSLFAITHFLRSRIRREISTYGLATAIVLNLFAYLIYTIGSARYLGTDAISFGPCVLNLLLSGLVLFSLNGAFFTLQNATLLFFGVNLAEEQREAR